MDCPNIPELDYADFGSRVREKIGDQRYPLSGAIELTLRCNLHCKHCYVASGNNAEAIQKELSTQDWYSIFDQMADAGVLWLLLTGGEPLTRPDFLDLYTYVKRKGFIFTLFTNGTLLTPKVADYIAEWLPFAVEITLYGRTEETYESITGIPGSYARCMRGIDLLMERKVPLRLKTMLLTLNKHELWDIKAYAESLGVPFRFDPMVNGSINGADAPLKLRLEPEEIVRFEQQDAMRWESLTRFMDRFKNTIVDPELLYVCGAGLRSFHINPYGEMGICMMVRTDMYDLLHGSFTEGWQNFIPEVRSQVAPPSYECAQCELRAICNQCPGWSKLEHNGALKPVDFLCEITKLRAQALGLISH